MASVDMFDKTFKIAEHEVDRQDQVAEGAGQLSIRLRHPSERRGRDHRWGVRRRDEKAGRTIPIMTMGRSGTMSNSRRGSSPCA